MREKHNQKTPAKSFWRVADKFVVMHKETDMKKTRRISRLVLEILSQEVGVSATKYGKTRTNVRLDTKQLVF